MIFETGIVILVVLGGMAWVVSKENPGEDQKTKKPR